MKIEVSEDGQIVLKEVFLSVGFETADGEKMSVCMRDNGFEFKYQGEWYSACNGEIIKLKTSDRGNILVDQSDHGPDDCKASPCSGFQRDSKTTSATLCICGREKREHPGM
jgi:hypothetical protein